MSAVDYWNRGSLLDRVEAERSDPDWIAAQWEHASVLPIDGSGQVACTADRAALRPAAAAGAYDPERCWLLGRLDEKIWFTTVVDTAELGESDTLRGLNAKLSDGERDLATAAIAIGHWHRLDPRCPHCGEPTVVINGGFARQCPEPRILFPRSDPAVIVAVLDEQGRILLGHQTVWDTGRVSTFAGFVEAGESLEQAVHREMAEETGLRLSEVTYFGSQPWPFPRSLMVGFAARAAGVDQHVDGVEIEYADWFTPAELAEAVRSGQRAIPGRGTIARRLIDAWLAGEFGDQDSGIELDSSW